MDDLGTKSIALLGPGSAPSPSPGSARQSSQAPQPSSREAQEPDRFGGWKTVGDQRDFYDEKNFLACCNPTSEKLKDRKEEDVVIFDYSLSLADENREVEGSFLRAIE